jgi:hypothetical protein
LSSKDFLDTCKRLMNPKEYMETEAVSLFLEVWQGGDSHSGDGALAGISQIRSAFLESFLAWERGFRNELSRLRARGSGKNEDAYVRKGRQTDEAVKAAAACFSVEDPLKAEIAIEKERWAAAERLSALSGFDLDFLIAYRIKLMINERLQSLAAEAGKNNYGRLYAEIFGAAELNAAAETSGERA